MAYGAKVLCNCVETGKAQPIPFPQYVSYDPEYGYDIDIPSELPKDERDKIWQAFWQWQEYGCQHSHQRLYISVGVNSAMTEFEALVERLHEIGEQYPLLFQYLPKIGVKEIPIRDIPAFLSELTHLENRGDVQTTLLIQKPNIVLIESSPFEYTSLVTMSGFNGNWLIVQIQADNHLYIAECDYETSELITEHFIAQHFSITKFAEDKFEFKNLDTGAIFENSSAFYFEGIDENSNLPLTAEFEIATKFIPISEKHNINRIITGLKTLCEFAIEMGNPIWWSKPYE